MLRGERIRSIVRAPLLAWRLAGEGRYDFTYDQMPIRLRGMSWGKRANLVRAGLNLIYRRVEPWAMPLHMQFELANYCNLRCPVCPAGRREVSRAPGAMPPELFAGVMEEVGPYLLTASLWGWGESLLSPHLSEILRIARRYPVVTFLSTNGQTLDREPVIEAILAHPPSYLIVALDGLTDETNSRYRVGARLQPALDGVRRLAELKKKRGRQLPVLHMRFLVMRHNEHEIEQLPSFARSHGFDMLTTRMLSTVHSEQARRTHADFMPERQEYRAGRIEQTRRDFVCMHPFWFPSVYADGTLVMCEQDAQASAPVGRLGAGVTFRSLWRSRRAADLRRTIRDDPGALSFCAVCPACDRGVTDASRRGEFFSPGYADPLIVQP